MLFLRRLDRYVMREFLKILLLSLFSLTAIFVLVHLMDHIDIYLDQGATWATIGKYYLLQTPYNLLLTMPMAMLIGTILSIGDFGRHGELTAMKASGISLYRIVLPLVVFALLLSLGVLALNETVVPRLNERVNRVYDEEILGEGPQREDYRGNFVYQNEEGYTYIVRSLFVEEGVAAVPGDADGAGGTGAGPNLGVGPDGPVGQPADRGEDAADSVAPDEDPEELVEASAEQVEIQRRLDDGTFVRINAPQMVWEMGTGLWVLRDGEMRVFPSGDEERMYTFTLLRSPELTDPPQELLAEDKEPEEMGYVDLERYIAKRERLGADTLEERVDLQMKLSYPFANFIIVLFGVALVGSAAHASRQSGTVGFGLALFLTLVFWGFLRVGQGIGYGGGLSPVWAAWLANGVFGVVGLVLLARART
jgi:lipopolysaccharide export LptBFGC system permease protein LptF